MVVIDNVPADSVSPISCARAELPSAADEQVLSLAIAILINEIQQILYSILFYFLLDITKLHNQKFNCHKALFVTFR